MNKLFKRILPCFLILLLAVTVASCKGKSKYKYPTQVPLYNSTEAFVKIGNLTVTKQDVFNRLLQSYGVEAIEDTIDAELLKGELTADQEKEFNKYMNELVYGTDDLTTLDEKAKEQKEKDFKLNCLSTGLHYVAEGNNDKLYYETYYKLLYKRQLKAIEVVKAEIEAQDKETKEDEDWEDSDLHFPTKSYLNYFNSYFYQTYDLIVVTFASEAEALAAMKNAGIDMDSLSGNWKKAGAELDKAGVKAAFLDLYKAAYGTEGEVKTYSYNDLTKIKSSSAADTTIAKKVATLSTKELGKSYTHAPLVYGNRYYLVFEDSVDETYIYSGDETVKFENTTEYFVFEDEKITDLTEKARAVIYEYLVQNEVLGNSTNYQYIITRVMAKLRQDAGLKIYAEGVENTYKTNYNKAFSALSITKYDDFAATTETSKDVVFEWNGGKVTVEEMYNLLTDRYGALISLLFAQQYVVLGSDYNKVTDFLKGEILDQKAYDKYAEKDYEDYKEAFLDGEYESAGYPASYGWDNFLRDYIGLSNEMAVVSDYNGSLYNDVLALYAKALWFAEVSDVKLDKTTWEITSDKWTKPYQFAKAEELDGVTVGDLFIIYSKDDVKDMVNPEGVAITYSGVAMYGHFATTYKKTIDGAEKTVLFVSDVCVDQAVQEKANKLYEDSFSLTVSGVYAWVDADLDGVADDLNENDDDTADVAAAKAANKALCTSLVNDFWSYVQSLYTDEIAKYNYPRSTVSEMVTKAIRTYNTSADAVWTNYKQKGLKLTAVSGASYTQGSSVSDDTMEVLRNMWKEVKNVSSSLLGQSLDPVYRYTENDVVKNIQAYALSTAMPTFFENSAVYKVAVTTAKTVTSNVYETSSVKQAPTYYLYTQYQLDSSDRDTTVYCSSQMSTYYVPSIKALTTDSIVNTKLMNDVKALLANVTFSANQAQNIATLEALINATIDEAK